MRAHPAWDGSIQKEGMDNLQFYPPPQLAALMWARFKNRRFSTVLDPQAGHGDLLMAGPRRKAGEHRLAVEIDVTRHPLLVERGCTVIGFDFFDCSSLEHVTHVIMNPPFRDGVEHVLHAWDRLYQAEIVAIINASSVRNANSVSRQRLLRLIEQHGDGITFLQDQFLDPLTERKTPVEIALIHLTKRAQANDADESIDETLAGLARDKTNLGEHRQGDDMDTEVVIPANWIENAVVHFQRACAAMVTATIAQSQARQLEERLATHVGLARYAFAPVQEYGPDWVQKSLTAAYAEIKTRAWAGVLERTEVQQKLSQAAHARLRAKFTEVTKMEFTVGNIRAFLLGLASNAHELQIGMVCDVFDLFCRYHENAACYHGWGWKSNSKHRSAGRRIKASRIIIPASSADSHTRGLDWDSEKMVSDIDKVFALLDGKPTDTEGGLVEAFKTRWRRKEPREDALYYGDRVTTRYFDVRYYRGIGTIHLYPRDPALIDRMNRTVGRHRRWLPGNDADASAGFWKHYHMAEKMDAAVTRRANAKFAATNRTAISWRALDGGSEEARREASDLIAQAVMEEATHRGMDLAGALAYEGSGERGKCLAIEGAAV